MPQEHIKHERYFNELPCSGMLPLRSHGNMVGIQLWQAEKRSDIKNQVEGGKCFDRIAKHRDGNSDQCGSAECHGVVPCGPATYSVGVRGDVQRKVALKFQVDAIRGRAGSTQTFRRETSRWNGKANIFTITMDFIF